MFKPNAVKRTVTGTFQKPDGSPSKGHISVELSQPVMGRQENTIYTRQKVEIELDSSGGFEKDLVITSPGLTTTEQADLDQIETDTDAKIEELKTVQEAINVYIEKIQNGTTITPADKAAYETNTTRKTELQLELAELSARNKVYADLIDRLKNNASIMTIHCRFTEPKDQSRIRLIIPAGDTAIDIADLERV